MAGAPGRANGRFKVSGRPLLKDCSRSRRRGYLSPRSDDVSTVAPRRSVR